MTHTDFNHLLTSIKALTPGQVRKLRQQLAQAKKPTAPTPGKAAKTPRRPRDVAAPKKKMTKDEFHRHLIEIGLMSHLPDTAADFLTIPTTSRSPSKESRCRKPSSVSGD